MPALTSKRQTPSLADQSMPVRPRFIAIPLALLAAMSLGASCSGNAQGDNQPGSRDRGPRVESIQGVDTSDLTRAESRVWVELINDLNSPCGEPISVGRCATRNSGCDRCKPAARYLARLITVGYERQDVESYYAARYDADQTVEISLEGAPSRGSPNAPVTIVEFSDFECPFCGQAHPIVQHLLEEFEGRVRLVFMHFPLSAHPHAMPAARASIAAGNQGKFWEMHDILFEHQGQLEDEDLERYAEDLDLDLERFRADVQAAETQRRIEQNQQLGEGAGVEGTPSFFINGRRFEEPWEYLSAYVREELDDE
jgi:protein-disulfide isomerase